MQFPAAAKALFILFGAICSAGIAFSQPATQASAVFVLSPDGNYQASWVDVSTTSHSPARRLIFVVDVASNKLLFVHCTFQRYTGAVWNGRSTACAIFDAPDNANVYLWILTRSGEPASGHWTEKKIDVEKLASERMPEVFAQNPVRMGLEKMKWKNDETIEIELTVNNLPVALKIPAM